MELLTGQRTHTLFDRIWLFINVSTIFYAFFFQYAVKSIDGTMLILCVTLIIFAIVQIMIVQRGVLKKSYLGPIILFVIVAVVISMVITSKGYGTDLSIRMVEYVLTAYSIYLLLKKNPDYIEIIMWSTSITIALLALASFVKGVEVSSSGAIGLEGLNSNSMSSFLLIMYFTSFCLFYKSRRFVVRMLLLCMIAVVAVVQVAAASRRGFVVLVLFTFLSLVFGIIPLKSGNKSRKKILFYILLLMGLAIALIFLRNYLLDNTLLGVRLMGLYDGGDAARDRYQAFAWQQFKEHPLLGIGLGGIAYYMGAYSHSLYYEIISCTGVLITMIFAYGIVKMLLGYWRSSKKLMVLVDQKAINYLSRIGFIFLLCILLSGIAVVMIYDFHFYFSLALLTVLLNRLNETWRKRLVRYDE